MHLQKPTVQLICSFDSFDKNNTVAMVVSLGLASKLPVSVHEYFTMAASLIHPHMMMQGIIIIPSMSALFIAYTCSWNGFGRTTFLQICTHFVVTINHNYVNT